MKKNNKDKKERKIRDILLTNFIIIMFFGVLIAMVTHVLGISVLLIETGGSEEFLVTSKMVMKVNNYMNMMIAIVLSLYSILHIINYLLYLFKNSSLLKIFMIIDLVTCIVSVLVFKMDIINSIIYVVPIISGFLYLKVLKIEGK